MTDQNVQPPSSGAPIPSSEPSPPQSPPPLTDPRQARAQAAAEKAHAKAMRPWYKKKRWWVVGAVAALIVVAALASGGDKKDDDNQASDDNTDQPAAENSDGGQDVYTVGQTAHTGDFDVTLDTVADPWTSSNQFDVPSEGNRFVAVELTLKNTTDEKRTFSSLLGAELKDSQSRPWNIAVAGVDLAKLDGDVAANESRRGWMVFQVPQDATGLQLRIKGDVTATGTLFQL